jgi:DNA polymerase theta
MCLLYLLLLSGVSCGTGLGSIGITPVPTSSGRLRACLESVLVNSVMTCLLRQLADVGLHQSFVDVEMPSLLILTKMELNGMGFNLVASEDQKSMIQAKLSALEDRAYQLAGHPFSLTSVDDVGQVLFVELRLPPPGDVQSSRSKPETRKTTAATR